MIQDLNSIIQNYTIYLIIVFVLVQLPAFFPGKLDWRLLAPAHIAKTTTTKNSNDLH